MKAVSDPTHILVIAVLGFFLTLPIMIPSNFYTTRTVYTVSPVLDYDRQEFIDHLPDGLAPTKVVPTRGYPFTAIVGLHEYAEQPTEFRWLGIAGNFLIIFVSVFTVLFMLVSFSVTIHHALIRKRTE